MEKGWELLTAKGGGAGVAALRPEVNSTELFGQREREPASIGQVERLIGADVDAGRIHRLAVVERPAQIEAAIAALRQFSRRLLARFHRADHFLPVCRAGLGRLQLD